MPKLLAEFLEEQQEPFALDAYLLERGYSIKKRASRRALNCARFVNVVVGLVLRNGRSAEDVCSESCTTKYNSCSESDVEDGVLEADGERKLKWRSVEEGSKQLSPVSVLEETESDEGSPLHQKQCKMKTTLVECSTPISHRKCRGEAMPEVDHSTAYAQYAINKRALQQTKQLLVDCVREVIESHRRRDDGKGQQLKKILGSEELWKLVCENVWVWSQDSIDRTNILHLLRSDFADSAQEWESAVAQQREEMSRDIGDAVLEDIIDEILMS